MKIIIIASKFPPIIGGGETCTHQLACQLHNLNHEILVVTNSHPLRKSEDFPFGVCEIEGFDESTGISTAVIPKLYSCFKDFAPDIIHVHNYLPLHSVLAVP